MFNDWDDLYAQLLALRDTSPNETSGRFSIVFDDSLAATVIPSAGNNTYDMTDTEWIGVRWFGDPESGSIVSVVVGDVFAGTMRIDHLLQITGLAITTAQDVLFSGGTPPIRIANQETLSLYATSVLNVKGIPIEIEPEGASVTIRLADESSFSTTGLGPVTTNAASTLRIHIDGADSSIGENTLGGDITIVNVSSSSGLVSLTQTFLSSLMFWNDSVLSRSGPFLAPIATVAGVSGSVFAGYTNQIDPSGAGAGWVGILPTAADFEKGEFLCVKNVTDSPIPIVLSGNVDGTVGGYSIAGARCWILLASDGVSFWSVISKSGAVYSPPEVWSQDNVPAGQTNVALGTRVAVLFTNIKMNRPGSIIALGNRLTSLITAGTMEIRVTINGVPGTLTTGALGAGSAGTEVTQAPGIDRYVAGDLIGLVITTSAGFTPITTDVQAWIQVQENQA